MHKTFTCLTLAVALQLSACGDEEKDLPDVECSGTTPAFEDVGALKKCATCHSTQLKGEARKGAEAAVNFDTKTDADKSAEDAAHEVYEGAMPPSGSGITLSNDEKNALYKWALCR